MFIQEFLLYGHQMMEVLSADPAIAKEWYDLSDEPRLMEPALRRFMRDWVHAAEVWGRVVNRCAPSDNRLIKASANIMGLHDLLVGEGDKGNVVQLLKIMRASAEYPSTASSKAWEGIRAQEVLQKKNSLYLIDTPNDSDDWLSPRPHMCLASHFTSEHVMLHLAVGRSLATPQIPAEVTFTLNDISWVEADKVSVRVGDMDSLDIALAKHEPRLPERIFATYMDWETRDAKWNRPLEERSPLSLNKMNLASST